MKIRYLLPLLLFFIIALILWRGLDLHPNIVPSPLINKAAPEFNLSDLENPQHQVSEKNFLGKVTLLNVWASWCYACAQEHAFLVELAAQKQVAIIGLNYKDDLAAAKRWLAANGNPYTAIAVDQAGVYGAPETFVIDKKGIVRYKQIGPITPAIWEYDLKPLVTQLQGEA
jgi:cytochrome c biogenesis protein CcmG/thiol:disulfide interchange protein DsbE